MQLQLLQTQIPHSICLQCGLTIDDRSDEFGRDGSGKTIIFRILLGCVDDADRKDKRL